MLDAGRIPLPASWSEGGIYEWLRRDPPAVVHVGQPGQPCRTAILMRAGAAMSRFRVLNDRLGLRLEDETGDIAHWSHPVIVASPGGGHRLMDTWHPAESCSLVRYPELPA